MWLTVLACRSKYLNFHINTCQQGGRSYIAQSDPSSHIETILAELRRSVRAEPAWRHREGSPDLRPRRATSPAGDQGPPRGIKLAFSRTHRRSVGVWAEPPMGRPQPSWLLLKTGLNFILIFYFRYFHHQI